MSDTAARHRAVPGVASASVSIKEGRIGLRWRRRQEREIRQEVDAFVEKKKRRQAEGQEAVARRGEQLRAQYRDVERAPIGEYSQACVVFSMNAAWKCLPELQLSARGMKDGVTGSVGFISALQRMSRGDSIWWDACSILRWGYL